MHGLTGGSWKRRADSSDHADNVDDIIAGIVERWVGMDGRVGTVAIGRAGDHLP
jgi:hypothetical protein